MVALARHGSPGWVTLSLDEPRPGISDTGSACGTERCRPAAGGWDGRVVACAGRGSSGGETRSLGEPRRGMDRGWPQVSASWTCGGSSRGMVRRCVVCDAPCGRSGGGSRILTTGAGRVAPAVVDGVACAYSVWADGPGRRPEGWERREGCGSGRGGSRGGIRSRMMAEEVASPIGIGPSKW